MILNGAGLNEVGDINLSVLVGMVENAHRETQNDLIRALMEFIRNSERFSKQKKKKKKKNPADTMHVHE